jgi:hypothetical protein
MVHLTWDLVWGEGRRRTNFRYATSESRFRTGRRAGEKRESLDVMDLVKMDAREEASVARTLSWSESGRTGRGPGTRQKQRKASLLDGGTQTLICEACEQAKAT